MVAATLPEAGRLVLLEPDGALAVARLGGSPHDVKAAAGLFVVANEGAARLDLVDRSGRVEGLVELPANPHDIAVSEDGRTLWVYVMAP